MNHVYDDLAEKYDLIYDDAYDAEFYLKEAKKANGPVLELACGTGRILLYLAKHGINVCGIDLSENMILKLKEKARGMSVNADVSCGDMRNFSLVRKFSLIIVPYRSFLHLKDDTERLAALKCIKNHLVPGGKVMLHVYLPLEKERSMTDNFHVIDRNSVRTENQELDVLWEFRYTKAGSMGEYRVTVTDKHSGTKSSYGMDLFFVSAKRMTSLLHQCGLQKVKLFCGFDYSEYVEDGNKCNEVLIRAEI